MSFADAVRAVLNNYAGFTGRARRSECWWFALFYLIAFVVAAIIDAVIGAPVVEFLVFLALIVPAIAVGARRLHDTGKSGWWLLISFIPFGGLVLLVFTVQDSQPGDNQYGPSPKVLYA